MPEIDFEAEGLLEGLEGDAREARLELLRELAADGIELEQLRQAVAAGRLALLPVERTLGGGPPKHTPREIAEQVGIPLESLQRLQRALGVRIADADARELRDADLEAARRVREFREAGLPEEGMLQVARTIGMATARIAQANRELIISSVVRPGDDERELARRLAASAGAMLPLIGPTLAYSLQAHLLDQVRRDVIGQADLAAGELGGASEVSVCFADLVDFTKLGEEIAIEELGQVAGRLEEMAAAVAEAPVQLVKLIGDAAMLVSEEPEPLLDAALRLVEAADQEGEQFPQLRAGVARGPALGQGGDYYGRPVNIASRITGLARPGSVLAEAEAKEAVANSFHFSVAGERRLKGIDGRVELFRVRREPKD